MFCLHSNEIDLKPIIVSHDNTDWVVVLCKACKAHIGERVRLVALVDEGISRARAQREHLDPDWELPG